MSLFVPGLGVDISENYVRIVAISFFGRIRDVEEIAIPKGLVEDGLVIDPDGLRSILEEHYFSKKSFSGERFPLVVSIPESRVFCSSVDIVRASKQAMCTEAFAKSKLKFPFDLSQTLSSFTVSEGENATVHACLEVVQKDVIERLERTFGMNNVKFLGAEPRMCSLTRTLKNYAKLGYQINGGFFAIFDMEEQWISVRVFQKMKSLFSRSVRLPSGQLSNAGAKVDALKGFVEEVVLYCQSEKFELTRCFVVVPEEVGDERPTNCTTFSQVVDIPLLEKKQVSIFAAAVGAARYAAHPFKRHQIDHLFYAQRQEK